MRMRTYLPLVAITILVALPTVSASAQTTVSQKVAARLAAAAEKIKAGCAEDLSKYCGTVTPGQGRTLFCMMAHEDKLSEKCELVLYSASRKMERSLTYLSDAADACWNDIEKHCANISAGGGRIGQCLIDNSNSVTKACRTAIGRFPAE